MKQVLLTFALTLATVFATAQSFTHQGKKYDWKIVFGSYETRYYSSFFKLRENIHVDAPLTILVSKQGDVAIVLKEKTIEYWVKPSFIIRQRNVSKRISWFVPNSPSVSMRPDKGSCEIFMPASSKTESEDRVSYFTKDLQTPDQMEGLLTRGESQIAKEEPKAETGEILDVVEVPAQFPGGEELCNWWISAHLKYPEIAKENEISGSVIVQFVVNMSGELVEEKVLKSPDPSLSKEALRLVKEMPTWTPAQKDGKPVSSRQTLRIPFKL